MSATNKTTHYNLPSFLGSDKPAWLVDWNGAMATIDSAIYEAKQAADTAGTSAAAVASDLATLSGTVSTQGSTISTLSETLTTAVGNINTINSLIGNGTPTTTDQTIIGAINEINARTGKADGISYDNTDSGLTATNVQDAIDEVNASLTTKSFFSGTSGTYGNQLDVLYTKFSTLTDDEKARSYITHGETIYRYIGNGLYSRTSIDNNTDQTLSVSTFKITSSPHFASGQIYVGSSTWNKAFYDNTNNANSAGLTLHW